MTPLSRLPALAALALGLIASAAQAQDITYRLINNTSAALIEFYTSPSASDDWGPDLLAGGTLEPGETGNVVIADGQTHCEYDLGFVFEDGSEFADTVDICELASYELVQQ